VENVRVAKHLLRHHLCKGKHGPEQTISLNALKGANAAGRLPNSRSFVKTDRLLLVTSNLAIGANGVPKLWELVEGPGLENTEEVADKEEPLLKRPKKEKTPDVLYVRYVCMALIVNWNEK
jgi:hypothetical protein